MKDLTGIKTHSVLITGFNRYDLSNKKYYWNCKCDCGKEFVALANNLVRKNHPMKSCGCQRANGIWKGFGEISLTYFHQITNNAEKRSIPFHTSIEEIWELFLDQNRKCALSGVELTFARCHGKSRTDQSASLDRLDSSKGYTKENLMWVHKDLNMMRSKVTLDKFIKWCKLISNYEMPLRSASSNNLRRFLKAYQDPASQGLG